jgi:hypothetical protein
MGSCTHGKPLRHPPFHAPTIPAHTITPDRCEGTNWVNCNSMFYNPLRNQKNKGCKTLMPHQWFPNILPIQGEELKWCLFFHTQHDLLQIGNT